MSATIITLEAVSVRVSKLLDQVECNLHKTNHEDADERHLCPHGHLQPQEDPERDTQDKKVGQNCQNTRDYVELPCDANSISFDRKIPVCLDRQTLQKCHKEDRNGMQDVKDVQPVDTPSHGLFLTPQSQEKDQDGRLDKGQDGIVDHLGHVEPP